MQGYSYLEFLRDVGKSFPVGAMMGKESVRSRLESESGLSYTEFSYMLLQGMDYLELAKRHQCTLQIGGSDQWGNIVAGMDLIRKKDVMKNLPVVIADYNKYGLTSVNDAGNPPGSELVLFSAVEELEKLGRLTISRMGQTVCVLYIT